MTDHNSVRHATHHSADRFPNGALITNASRTIIYVNAYFTTELLWQTTDIIGKNLDVLFTKPSSIFFQSYIVPTLSHERMCEEMQLTIFNANGKRIPITVNATVKENGCIYWSFFNSSKRDQLYDELIKAREKLTEALEKVNILASLDDLTGLLNRREMKHKSAHAIEKAASQGQTVTLLLLDIDHFKKINDSYGHLEGDRVLMALGTLLKKSIEQQNNMEKMGLVSRFGGEEFLILLTNITEADALSFCNRLHRSMADIVVGGAPLKASIGVSTLTPGMTFEALFTQADGAMYQAKERGRDRTEIFTSA